MFRLEQVARGLIERLDGARRSYATREEAERGLRGIAEEQIEGVLASWTDLPFAPEGPAQAAFVRRELLGTMLPRFVEAAVAMNEAERDGFGLKWWASPAGRVALFAIALLVLRFGLLRFEELPVVWPVTLLDLALPFLPDILATLQRRRYQASLEGLLVDLGRIQDAAALAPQPVPSLGPVAEPSNATRAATARVTERR